MDSVKTKIEELQKDIDEKWDSLRSAGYELAQLSARMTEGPVTLISPTLRRAFTDAQNDFVFLKSQNLEREELVRRLDEGKRKVSFLRRRISLAATSASFVCFICLRSVLRITNSSLV